MLLITIYEEVNTHDFARDLRRLHSTNCITMGEWHGVECIEITPRGCEIAQREIHFAYKMRKKTLQNSAIAARNKLLGYGAVLSSLLVIFTACRHYTSGDLIFSGALLLLAAFLLIISIKIARITSKMDAMDRTEMYQVIEPEDGSSCECQNLCINQERRVGG